MARYEECIPYAEASEDRDESSTRCSSSIDDDLGVVLTRIGTDFATMLFEHVRVPLVLLDGNDVPVARNATARRLLADLNLDVDDLIDAVGGVLHTPSGTLLISHRTFLGNGQRHTLLMLKEAAVDANEIQRIATLRWQPTNRQAEVLRGLIEGLANKEIAAKVGASPRTIEVHVTALLAKAGVDSRTRLVAKARELATVGASSTREWDAPTGE